jgi:hypothetical protein
VGHREVNKKKAKRETRWTGQERREQEGREEVRDREKKRTTDWRMYNGKGILTQCGR